GTILGSFSDGGQLGSFFPVPPGRLGSFFRRHGLGFVFPGVMGVGFVFPRRHADRDRVPAASEARDRDRGPRSVEAPEPPSRAPRSKPFSGLRPSPVIRMIFRSPS